MFPFLPPNNHARSINRRDIMGAELGMLLAASRSRDMDAGGAPLCRQTFSYWASTPGLHHAAKLELALRRSVATVACFSTWDVYGDTGAGALRRAGSVHGGSGGGDEPPVALSPPPSYQEEECPLSAAHHAWEREQWGSGRGGSPRRSSPPSRYGEKPPTPRGVPDMDWNWLLPPSPSGGGGRSGSSAPPRKNLVGFARATGDNSLVATVYDVAVHPALRGYGIGGRLVKLLLQQVQARGVYDIGAVTPADAAGFWGRCAFEDDREGSTFMAFVGERDSHQGEDWAPRTAEELLEACPTAHWDAAQRSESLRSLLGKKLERMREGGEAGPSGPAGRAGYRPSPRGGWHGDATVGGSPGRYRSW
ncbi:hypothetical protein GPECTOR_47g326 [Gonium pectorale]|uniref:N-acetyltransferase domain-containing protein n=1 Tax=Gonium pectorale TaxID=33097 RepID=A0A150G8B5_GONPE|nr:hypothetical protein GPECTOR_47g326 [Gonium pectorale]|eukprot:KXZ46051.1 hypothetical protein GPECTOR_47g326 [Gonium pectorale]